MKTSSSPSESTGQSLVVVESPAKATTLGRYLGAGYKVLASYGHVRDLEQKDGAVDPDHDFLMRWETSTAGRKRLKEIAEAAKSASTLYLATDPDREGEAIAWHIYEELKNKIKGKEVKRIAFNSITKTAVTDAIAHPRQLDHDLVDAYRARRGLDFLVGFRLSPVLWRKMPGSKSAGRVQSVALRIICEREDEIDAFRSQPYWQIVGEFTTAKGEPLTARLRQLEGKKIEKLSITTAAEAEHALTLCREGGYRISEHNTREEARRPAPPFNTSSLQQDASRKLHFSTSQTMQLAQKLYEGVGSLGGLITYMRTDGISMNSDAIAAIRQTISKQYGDEYLPEKVRLYKNKSKNAQEAHEAIRPTDPLRHPDSLTDKLEPTMLKLYRLIWQRAVASQMRDARIERVSLDIAGPHAIFRATGQTLLFPGFLTLYNITTAGVDDTDDNHLPKTKAEDVLTLEDCKASEHATQPPARYSEASLVKKMEEIGIGRPSTYASTLKLLQDRGYVELQQRAFHAADRGRLVTCFLNGYFARYLDYDFTANLENQLDEISNGATPWLKVMAQFWKEFWQSIEAANALSATEVRDYIDQTLGAIYFGRDDDKTEQEARRCPVCGEGRLQINFGRYGLFVGCGRYPDCKHIQRTDHDQPGDDPEAAINDYPKNLGQDSELKRDVLLCKGPYGFYVQREEDPPKGKKKAKPKRVGLLKGMEPGQVDLKLALKLLALPRVLGKHPDTDQEIKVGVGRYGPYLVTDGKFTSLPKEDHVLDVGLNRAITVLAEQKERKGRQRGRGAPGTGPGQHPDDNANVVLKSGRYGPYVQHHKVLASLPKGTDPEGFTLEEALPLLEARRAKTKKA